MSRVYLITHDEICGAIENAVQVFANGLKPMITITATNVAMANIQISAQPYEAQQLQDLVEETQPEDPQAEEAETAPKAKGKKGS